MANKLRIVTMASVILNVSLGVMGSLLSSHAAEVVVFWNIHGTARGEAWQVLVDEFNQTRDDLRIVLEQPASGTEGVNQLLVAVAAGTPPDLVYLDRGYLGQHMGTGMFEPLNAYVERAGWDILTDTLAPNGQPCHVVRRVHGKEQHKGQKVHTEENQGAIHQAPNDVGNHA